MSKEPYISEGNRRMGYIPENDYDPRYYDAGGSMTMEDLTHIGETFGYDSFSIPCDAVLYTDNVNVMRYMQDDMLIEPMWFDTAGDDVSTVDELRAAGWAW